MAIALTRNCCNVVIKIKLREENGRGVRGETIRGPGVWYHTIVKIQNELTL
jgi:hypothetical protein